MVKNEETGRISYYTSKKEVVYTSLLMCENAPQEWQELTQKLNNENSLLLKQSRELLTLNSR